MKKRKVNKKNFAILIVILLVILIEIINPIKLYSKHQLKQLGFNNQSIEVILDNKLKKNILELGFNETLDKVLNDSNFDIKNFDIYKDLKYYNFDSYTKNVNKLIKLGYLKDDINNILKSADNESFNDFLEKDYIKNISKYLSFDFAKLSNIDRYLDYQAKNNVDAELVVVNVNIGLDKKFYEDTTKTDQFSYDMLVNKYHGISEDFTPLDIVDVPSQYGKDEKLNETALKAFIKMSEDCKANTNYKLLVNSGYRDLKKQEETYNYYLKAYGKTYAENYVIHTGFSEHHTGLAIDIKAESSNTFSGSKESKWAYSNAYKYGFILRYQKDFEDVTGVKYESWHFRYVGLEIAKYIYEHQMPYEEYYVRFIEK